MPIRTNLAVLLLESFLWLWAIHNFFLYLCKQKIYLKCQMVAPTWKFLVNSWWMLFPALSTVSNLGLAARLLLHRSGSILWQSGILSSPWLSPQKVLESCTRECCKKRWGLLTVLPLSARELLKHDMIVWWMCGINDVDMVHIHACWSLCVNDVDA